MSRRGAPLPPHPGLADAGLIAPPEPEAKPHHLGHRHRLRERLMSAGAAALPDYELLEFLLFAAIPRGDTKPLAKDLLHRFGGLAQKEGMFKL